MKTTKIFMRMATMLVAPLIMASCGGDGLDLGDLEDLLGGKVPGLGNKEGNLTGTPFALPAGVSLVEPIQGADSDVPDYWYYDDNGTRAAAGIPTSAKPNGSTPLVRTPLSAATRADEPAWLWRGSGEGYVDLVVKLKNDGSSAQTVTFPAALIVKSVSGASQHGVLIKKATVSIPAGGQCNVVLTMYCGNLFRDSVHGGEAYEWGVVSDSPALKELCDLVKNKKINIEEFTPGNTNDYLTYIGQASELQSIVWNVTDWSGLDDDDREYIASLPNS